MLEIAAESPASGARFVSPLLFAEPLFFSTFSTVIRLALIVSQLP
jgi:hypothetical protein